MPEEQQTPTEPDLDGLRRRVSEQDRELTQLRQAVVHWRAQALQGWAEPVAAAAPERAEEPTGPGASAREHQLERELDAMRHTVSWRVTAPLRLVRRLAPGRG